MTSAVLFAAVALAACAATAAAGQPAARPVAKGHAAHRAAAAPPAVCAAEDVATLAHCNPRLPRHQRAAELAKLLSTEEKLAQVSGGPASAISRLHIAASHWSDGAVPAAACGGHLLPSALSMAASFNATAFARRGQLRASLLRAAGNAGQPGCGGMSPLAAVQVNLLTDMSLPPAEAVQLPGEDPLLAAAFAEATVRGLQEGEDMKYLKVAAACSALLAQAGDASHGISRRDMVEAYLQPFHACVSRGRAAGIVCGDGLKGSDAAPCGSPALLDGVLRRAWHFRGVVLSSPGAITALQARHIVNSAEEAAAAAMNAGCDVATPRPASHGGRATAASSAAQARWLAAAVDDGLVRPSKLTRALVRQLGVRMQLGEFDDAARQLYRTLSSSAATAAAKEETVELAEQSIVLLRNKDATLPLSAEHTPRLLLLAPDGHALLSTAAEERRAASLHASLTAAGFSLTAAGMRGGMAHLHSFAHAVDAVLVVVTADSSSAALRPSAHTTRVLRHIGKLKLKSILLLADCAAAQIDEHVHSSAAVLWLGSSGAAAGAAAGSVLTGEHNPAARLPFTFYASADWAAVTAAGLPMQLRQAPGRTYRFYQGRPLFAFGAGLSYTNWALSWAGERPPPPSQLETDGDSTISLRLRLSNTGSRAGDRVLLLFVSVADSSGGGGGAEAAQQAYQPPRRWLLHFRRLFVPAADTRDVTVVIHPQQLALVSADGRRALLAGTYVIDIDGQLSHRVVVSGDAQRLASLLPSSANKQRRRRRRRVASRTVGRTGGMPQ
eukprot:PLAT6377.1.p1 GENE.PLAT6377.1~~PLAT6377.1.p1  ORF type:complete len:782 (+),score=395.03 PLAT6377.1:14-2359(+)